MATLLSCKVVGCFRKPEDAPLQGQLNERGGGGGAAAALEDFPSPSPYHLYQRFQFVSESPAELQSHSWSALVRSVSLIRGQQKATRKPLGNFVYESC